MLIQATNDQPHPGDLKAEVRGDTLLLPRSVVKAARDNGIHTAEELLSYIEAFPTSMASVLNWTVPDMSIAIAGLKQQLRGHLPDEQIDVRQRARPAFGALDPRDLPKRS